MIEQMEYETPEIYILKFVDSGRCICSTTERIDDDDQGIIEI